MERVCLPEMFDDYVEIVRDERHIKRERAKARELKQSSYFQEQLRRGICRYCGRKFPREELTIDHIVPVARGGRSTRGNMVVCCLDCNQKKRCLTPAEMILFAESRKEEQSGERMEGDN